MPLIQLQTNLKSLTFGRDRPGGGSSNQPYVTVDIPQTSEDFPDGIIPIPGGADTDFLVRNGLNVINDTAKDLERLGKYFAGPFPRGGSPSGLLFTIKQNLLSRISTKTQFSGILNEGVYTPLSSLTQAGINAFGLHVRKQGLIPFVEPKTYINALNQKDELFNQDKIISLENNRLILLKQIKIEGKTLLNPPGQISPRPTEILAYGGGPNSIIGIGKTRILFATNQQGAPLRTGINNGKEIRIGSKVEKIQLNKFQSLIEDNPLPIGASPKYNSILPIDDNNFIFDPIGQNSTEGYYLLGDTSVYKTPGESLEAKRKFSNKFTAENLNQITLPPLDLGGGSTINIATPIEEINALPLGASFTYQKITKDIGGGTFPLIEPVKREQLFNLGVTPEESFYLKNNTSVYEGSRPGNPSLTPRTDLKTYQVGNKLNFTTNQFKPILRGGAGDKYLGVLEASGNSNVGNTNKLLSVTSEGGLTFEPNFEASVYVSSPTGSLKNSTRIFDNNTFTLNTQQLQDKATLSLSNEEFPDFRKTLIDDNNIKKSSTLSISPSYEDAKNKLIDGPTDSRINYASPGQKGNIISYTKGKFVNNSPTPNITDRLNALPLYKSTSVAATQQGDAGGFKNDLVKFRIAAIDTNNPTEKVFMHFRAYIDSFSDQYNANWNQQKYMGRGEPFYKYDNFQRDINLSFTVAAQSKPEIMVMYRKLNYLASTLAPDYTDAGYMAGNLVQLTMGGWCYELPGFIRSLTLDVPEESPWEIGINDKGTFDDTVKEMPHICKVTGLTFTPIHTFRPSIVKLTNPMPKPEQNLEDNNEYGNQRYLALKQGENNNYDNRVNWYT